MRTVLAVALLLLIALGLALWFSSGERGDGAAVASLTRERVAGRAEVELAANLEGESEPIPGVVVEARSAVEVDAPAAPPETVVLNGKVLVSGADREVHPSENGVVELIDVRQVVGREANYRARVVAGAFSVEVYADALLMVKGFELGGQPAYPLSRSAEAFDVSPNVTKFLRARWAEPTTLRVVAQATGLDLSGVTLVRAPSDTVTLSGGLVTGRVVRSAGERASGYPGLQPASDVELRGGRSPLHLYPALRSESYRTVLFHVHVPGFAWAEAKVDFSNREPSLVELDPGGDLEVRLSGAVDQRNLFLSARPKPSVKGPDWTLPVEGRSSILLEGLFPGEFELTAHVGNGRLPQVVASAEVEIVAGELTRAELHVPPAPAPVGVPLAGTIHVPAAWNLDSPPLELVRRGPGRAGFDNRLEPGALKLQRIRGATWSWAAEVLAGTWIARLSAAGFEQEITVPSAGRTGLFLDVPPPAFLIVSGFDPRSGSAVELVSVFWRLQGNGAAGWVGANCAGRCELAVPAGEVEIRAGVTGSLLDGDAVRGRVIIRGASDNTVRVELAPGERKEVRLPASAVRIELGRRH